MKVGARVTVVRSTIDLTPMPLGHHLPWPPRSRDVYRGRYEAPVGRLLCFKLLTSNRSALRAVRAPNEEGVTWVRGWGSPAARALRAEFTLEDSVGT